MSSSSFAQAARARKVAAIVAHLDAMGIAHGMSTTDPRTAEFLAKALRNMSSGDWASVAVCCGQRPPSSESIAAIVAVYEHRAANWAARNDFVRLESNRSGRRAS